MTGKKRKKGKKWMTGKKWIWQLALVCAGLLSACTFGGAQEPVQMGRYVETAVDVPGGRTGYVSLVQEGKIVRLTAHSGHDLVTVDGGETFAEEDVPELRKREYMSLRNLATAPDGAWMYETAQSLEPYTVQGYYLVTGEGEEKELAIARDGFGKAWYGGGYFYCQAGDAGGIYRIDPAAGDVSLLLEDCYAENVAAGERVLYLLMYDTLRIFDLEKGEIAAKQDEVLEAFVREKTQAGVIDSGSTFLYPWGDGIYLVTGEGLYWHSLYGEDVELVIDGAVCSMGIPEREVFGLAVLETEGEPDFLFLYSDGSLTRCSYDASLTAEPEISLRVYSLYEDGNVRRMAGAFRKAHPELTVRYETGAGMEYGATEEDALKNFATELAAGKGPDIIVADEIPFRSYVEKGVLLDLAPVREGMTEAGYYLNVIDGFRSESGIYVIPLSFAIPVIGGNGAELEGLKGLSDLADLFERKRGEGNEGTLYEFWDADDALRLLSQSCQGAWTGEDGALDREAVEDFLVQAKRIYTAQMEGQEEYRWTNSATWAGGGSPLDRRFTTGGINPARAAVNFAAGHGRLFFGGFIGINEADFPYWCANADYMGADYTLMPGQQYGACLAESLIAVNQASGHREEALQFLEFALSAEGQEAADLNGVPVNREACLAGWKDPRGEGNENLLYSGCYIDNGDADYENDPFLPIYWPEEEEFRKLDGLISGIRGAGYCDSRVYRAVVEAGQDFLKGKSTLEEALTAVEDRVKLYLEE